MQIDHFGNITYDYPNRNSIYELLNKLLLFQNHKKKDDLADCFLQGFWYLKEKLII